MFVNRTKELFEAVTPAALPLPRRTRTSRIKYVSEKGTLHTLHTLHTSSPLLIVSKFFI
jgi:hypothetical protein